MSRKTVLLIIFGNTLHPCEVIVRKTLFSNYCANLLTWLATVFWGNSAADQTLNFSIFRKNNKHFMKSSELPENHWSLDISYTKALKMYFNMNLSYHISCFPKECWNIIPYRKVNLPSWKSMEVISSYIVFTLYIFQEIQTQQQKQNCKKNKDKRL